MKRQAVFLVSKRDGRREWLRATKLARSIRIALQASGIDERCHSLDLATRVVAKLHKHRANAPIGSGTLAAMAQEELIRSGYSLAALLFAEAGQRTRRSEAAATTTCVEDRAHAGRSRPTPAPFWSDDRLFGSN